MPVSLPLNGRKLNSDFMYPLIELWMHSDRTQQSICEEYSIKPHTFNYWRSKYRKENEASNISKEDTPGFVPIKVEQPTQEQASTEKISYSRKKKRHPGRHPLPEHLPRTQIVIEPDMDTTDMVCIGQEVSEVLAKQPSTYFVIEIIRKKYAKADGSGVVIGKMPSRAIEKSMAHESLLAFILVSKFVDHLPLHRLAQMMLRQGVRIPTSTLSDWVNACCKFLLPLYEALKKEVFMSNTCK